MPMNVYGYIYMFIGTLQCKLQDEFELSCRGIRQSVRTGLTGDNQSLTLFGIPALAHCGFSR